MFQIFKINVSSRSSQDVAILDTNIEVCCAATTGEVVMLHLTLVQQTTNGSTQLVGYGFMEALSYVHIYFGGILLQPELVRLSCTADS